MFHSHKYQAPGEKLGKTLGAVNPNAPGGMAAWAFMLSSSLGNDAAVGRSTANARDGNGDLGSGDGIIPSDAKLVATDSKSGTATYVSESQGVMTVNLKDIPDATTLGPQSSGGSGWYSDVGMYNWFFSSTATGLSNTAGSFRLSTTKQGFSPKFYANSWRGNQYAKTFNIAKMGRLAGRVSFGIGVVSDLYGVRNYYKYGENSPNSVSPGKASVNTAMGLWGFTGVGTIPSIVYFGAEAFYPGGALGLFNDSGYWHDDTQRILGPGWRPIPFGGK